MRRAVRDRATRVALLAGVVLALLSSALLAGAAPALLRPAPRSRTAVRAAPSRVLYVPRSTRVVCALTGHGETGTRTASGLISADHGYSLRYHGQLWFLFGDAQPAPTFGHPPVSNLHRYPFDTSGDAASLVNDAIGVATGFSHGCPRLALLPQTSPASAYANPYLYAGGTEISLRTNESASSGISVGGKLYVLFVTGNPTPTNTPAVCQGQPTGCLGYPFTSAMGVLDPQPGRPLNFDYLYTLSGPLPGSAPGAGPPGRFVNVSIAPAGRWLYLWGTSGGSQHGTAGCQPGLVECYRHSNVYLARMPRSAIGQHPAGGRPAGVEYWDGQGWESGTETGASPLFAQKPLCMGELSVQHVAALKQWLMLYNCASAHPKGVLMRTAPAPTGPWSAPQTIFNPVRDHGYCHFIAHPTCTGPLKGNKGADYGPYMLPGRTAVMTRTIGTRLRQTIVTLFYTLDTFDPYGQMIMASTVAGPITGPGVVPPCHKPCS